MAHIISKTAPKPSSSDSTTPFGFALVGFLGGFYFFIATLVLALFCDFFVTSFF